MQNFRGYPRLPETINLKNYKLIINILSTLLGTLLKYSSISL